MPGEIVCRCTDEINEQQVRSAQVVYQGILQLSPTTQHEVARRIRALANWQDGPVTCPCLDATRIQALYEAGVCDGVILGNQGPIERALHQQ